MDPEIVFEGCRYRQVSRVANNIYAKKVSDDGNLAGLWCFHTSTWDDIMAMMAATTSDPPEEEKQSDGLCEECYGTGFTNGIGHVCSKGCKAK